MFNQLNNMKMKTMKLKKVAMTLAALMVVGLFTINSVYSQRGKGWGDGPCRNQPKQPPVMAALDLNEEQQEQMKEFHTAHLKEMLPIKNKMQELKAELNTLSSGDDVDMKAVNNKIDEISDLHAKMMKMHEANRQEVREILDEEQKVLFDAFHSKRGKGQHGKGSMHRGFHGKGYGRGPCGGGMGPGFEGTRPRSNEK